MTLKHDQIIKRFGEFLRRASSCAECSRLSKNTMSRRAMMPLVKSAVATQRLPIAALGSLAVLVGIVSGCSEGVERVKVSGRVLIDGEPVSAGFIRVYPKGVRDSSSNLDSEGRFDLRSYKPGDGIALGTHIVTVNGSEMIGPSQKKWHAPPGYAKISSSKLKLEVTGSTEGAVIELTWGKGKPFVQRLGRGGE